MMQTFFELLLNWRFWALMSPVLFFMAFAIIGGIAIEIEEHFNKEREW